MGIKKRIAIIPARGGSKGIPRKNLRPVAGKPLIYYSIMACLKSSLLDRVVVSTDDDEIALLAERFGADVLMRSKHLSDDLTTLDPVIFSAVQQAEKKWKEDYRIIVTVQPTSPLIVAGDKDTAIGMFKDEIDTVMTVVDDRHLNWTIKDGKASATYMKRVNRQNLPVNYKETGALIACTRNQLEMGSRIGRHVELLEVPHDRSFDIDTFADLMLCENLIKRKRIVFTVAGSHQVGLGHAYRALMLAHELVSYDIHFVCEESSSLAIQSIRNQHYTVHVCDDGALAAACVKVLPDLVINDVLDTSSEYISFLKENSIKVINFEDLGKGAEKADLVINALYAHKKTASNMLSGSKYFCLRDEFLHIEKATTNKEVRRILLTFGGVDEGNLSARCLAIIAKYCKEKKIVIDVVTGPGYIYEDRLTSLMDVHADLSINLAKGTKRISDYMNKADVAITSGGRTVLELSSLHVPTIVICQNDREMTHDFASLSNGIINLGNRLSVEDVDILNALIGIVENRNMRMEMIIKSKKNNLSLGKRRVISEIVRILDEESLGAG